MIQATQILVGASVQLVWAQADNIGFMQVSEYYFLQFVKQMKTWYAWACSVTA